MNKAEQLVLIVAMILFFGIGARKRQIYIGNANTKMYTINTIGIVLFIYVALDSKFHMRFRRSPPQFSSIATTGTYVRHHLNLINNPRRLVRKEWAPIIVHKPVSHLFIH